MRITGSGKLDPDFTKIKKKEKVLGRVSSESLAGRIQRIDAKCSGCAEQTTREVVLLYHPLLGGAVPFVKLAKTHVLRCTRCSEGVELDTEEYLRLRPFLEKVR